MFQKFYTDTLGGRFIKSLLAQIPVPLFDCVVDGDYLVQGRYYVYKRFIIQCVTSGILAVDPTDELWPSEKIYCSEYLYALTGYRSAAFIVKSYQDPDDLKTYSVFKSSTNYYDSETHYHLGRYLRYLYTTTGLNLFPFYNMYNSTFFSDVQLSVQDVKNVSITRVSTQTSKVIAVPILFGHTYTIALDSPTEVVMRACIHDNSGYIDEDKLPDDSNSEITSLKDTLRNSGRVFSNLRFAEPVTFRVETSSPSALMLQHNLYLLIQLSQDNNSSIVVLENYASHTGVRCNSNNVKLTSILNLSLLRMNTRKSYAFSDRLIEYLLGNVIFPNDNNLTNISKVQTAIAKIYPEYNRAFIQGKYRKGIWDSSISNFVQDLVEKTLQDEIIYDQDGNINRDLEFVLSSKGGSY